MSSPLREFSTLPELRPTTDMFNTPSTKSGVGTFVTNRWKRPSDWKTLPPNVQSLLAHQQIRDLYEEMQQLLKTQQLESARALYPIACRFSKAVPELPTQERIVDQHFRDVYLRAMKTALYL